jgi:serine/threonine-protein kinase
MDKLTEAEEKGKIRQIGDYKLEGKLGQGAMGIVFKATDVRINRPVALKVLSPTISQNERSVQRFFREARTAGRLQHPNIVKVYDMGQSPEGYFYLAMEFVEGESLARRIRTEKALDPRKATEVVLNVARGLQHAESVGMVHRDIKPENILIDKDGTPKIVDFGLAKTHEDPTVTQAGGVIGTPHYMSPEQAEGREGIDVRADIYSLGATYYHAVVGKTPFQGETVGVIMSKQINEPPPQAHEHNVMISKHISWVILKMMAKRVEDRYQTTAELIGDLEKLLRGESPDVSPRDQLATLAERRRKGAPARGAAAPRKTGVLAVMATAAGLLLIAGAVYILVRPGTKQEKTAISSANDLKPEKPLGTVDSDLRKKWGLPDLETREQDANSALKEAEAYATENPADFQGQIKRYQDLVSDFQGTNAANKAKEAMTVTQLRWDAEAKSAFDGLKQEADALVSKNEYSKAIAVWERFPKELANDAYAANVEKEKNGGRQAAEEAFGKLKEESRKLAEEGKFEAARDALKPALAFGIDTVTNEAETEIAELERRGEEEKGKVHEKAALALEDLVPKIRPLLEARDYPGALQALESQKQQQADLPVEAVKELQTFIDPLAKFWKAVEEGSMKLKKGEPFSVRGTKGTVLRCEGGKIVVDAGGAEVGRKLMDLNASEAISLAHKTLDQNSGDAQLQLALFLVSDKEAAVEAARQHFDAAAEKGTDVQPYQRVFEMLEQRAAEEAAEAKPKKGEKPGTESTAKTKTRTQAEIVAAIEAAGKSRPEWWAWVPMADYPRSLDLRWPKPSGGWDARQNVGQYLWSIVYQDPALWEGGAKLVHHVLELNKNDPEVRQRALLSLADMYANLLEDHARGAFYYRQAKGSGDVASYGLASLAYCYWKLGSKKLAAEVLSSIPKDPHLDCFIRLCADMGLQQKALDIASEVAKNGMPDIAYLAAGHACRRAGKYKQAADFYKKVLTLDRGEASNRFDRNRDFAEASLGTLKCFESLDISKLPDGAYRDSCTVFNSRVVVEVVLKGGKIAECKVLQSPPNSFRAVFLTTPRQIVEKNGIKTMDVYSPAPVMTDALLNAVAWALGQAEKSKEAREGE